MGILNRKVSFRLFAVGLILVLAVIFTAVCVPVLQEDIRETGRAAVREAVLRSAVESRAHTRKALNIWKNTTGLRSIRKNTS